MYAVTKEYIEHNIIADIDKKSVLIPNNKDNHLLVSLIFASYYKHDF